LVLDAGDSVLVSPALRAFGPLATIPEATGMGRKWAATLSATAATLPADALLPDDLVSSSFDTTFEPLAIALRARAAALAWAWLGGTVDVSVDGLSATITIFGYRARQLAVPFAGIQDALEQDATLGLYRWVTDEESSDRVLAVRQVASVYEVEDITRSGEQIRRGALPVYKGLRSLDITDAVLAQREARTIALATARSSADAVLSGAKSLTERVLAGLLSLGAVVVAKALQQPPPRNVTADLAGGIAVVMVVFAIISLIVEGPSLGTPLAALEDDLRASSRLLTEEEVTTLSTLRSVKLARRRARTIRIMCPIVYLGVAAVALTVAYPRPRGFWRLFGLQ
jgi:hypothetical protein